MAQGAQRSFRAHPVRSIRGALRVPGDKSISHRALMLAGIADGETRVSGFLESEDCLATLAAMRALGVSVERPAAEEVRVRGVGLRGLRGAPAPLDMGNAGTAMRLFTGLLAGQQFDSTLIGDASLMKRPMDRVAAPLRLMGADVRTTHGVPPVQITGRRTLNGIRYPLPMASAQVKSAVLLAGLYAHGPTTIIEPAVTRDHSERMLRSFGVDIETEGRTVKLLPPRALSAADIEVPGDFSSAAFFIVAGCLAAEGVLTIRGVGVNPTRTGLLEILTRMGAEIRVVNPRTSGAEPVADLEIERRELTGIEVPRALVPLAIDEFPALFIAAASARGETVVSGAEELRVKESDRILAMADGLRVLGIRTQVAEDGMRIQGGRLRGGRIDSLGDHRIAMAFAIASVCAREVIEVTDVANVATSFPGFTRIAGEIGLAIDEHGS